MAVRDQREARTWGTASATRDVIALEPGLWDKSVGGVVSEDLVLVTETGCEVLTNFPYDLTPAA